MDMVSSMSIAIIVVFICMFLGVLGILTKFFVKVSEGEVIIKSGVGGTVVSFSSTLAIPNLHSVEILDITAKQAVLERRDKNAVICRDNVAMDIKIVFFMRINSTEEDILKTIRSMGCGKASDPEAISLYFESKFSESLETAARRYESSEIFNAREQFKKELGNIIGNEIDGFVIEDIAVNFPSRIG